MARDRELILKRIAYQIAEADKAKNIASVYARGEILGLTRLREYIDALPAEPEPILRWLVCDGDGEPTWVFKDHDLAGRMCLRHFVTMKQVEIREVKNG